MLCFCSLSMFIFVCLVFSENVYRDTWSLFVFCLFASVVGLPLPLRLKTWNIKPKSCPLSAQLLFLWVGGSMSLWTWWHPLPDRNKNKKMKAMQQNKRETWRPWPQREGGVIKGARQSGSNHEDWTRSAKTAKPRVGKKMCEYPWAWSLFLWPWAPDVDRVAFLIWILTSLWKVMGKRDEDEVWIGKQAVSQQECSKATNRYPGVTFHRLGNGELPK